MNQFLSLLLSKFLLFCTLNRYSLKKSYGKLLVMLALVLQTAAGFAQTQPYYPPEVKDPKNQTNVNGIWYYTSNYTYECTGYNADRDYCLDYYYYYDLWRSNGTAGGTVKIKTFYLYGSSEYGFGHVANAFIGINNTLYFINNTEQYAFTLSKIDNSSLEVVDIRSFGVGSYRDYNEASDYNLTNVNGTLFFIAEEYYFGRELWKSDGTEAGTVMVKDIRPGSIGSAPDDLSNENGLLYFTADDSSGRKLWKSDGTEAGTVKTVAPPGKIGREYWANITGTAVSAIPLTTAPTSTSELSSFEGPTNVADNYGSRIRGYIQAPVSGNYTFWIASDDNSELWLSTDENGGNKRKIASVTGWTAAREWAKFASQKSASIALQGGKSYYIEALHKEGLSGDNVAVGWQLPDGTLERPIPGKRLSPLSAPVVSITAPAANTTFTAGSGILISASAADYTSATDSDGGITKVEFFANNTKLAEDATSPYTYYWSNIPAGNVILTARAINKQGLTTSTAVNVTIRQLPGTAKEWDKIYGTTSGDIPEKIIQTTDGGYLIGGSSSSQINGDKTGASRGYQDYWIVKVNSSGAKQWDKTFGGSDTDLLTSIIQTSDGGYLLGGYSRSTISGDKSEANKGSINTDDYWIVKIDASGNKQWDKTYGGNSNDVLSAMVATNDGGYLLGGTSSSGISGDKTEASRGENDYWIVKISSNGSKQWDKTYGGSNDEQLKTLVPTTDGGFVLAGYSNSQISGEKTTANKGGNDYWVVKINSNGNKQWDKTFGGSNEDLAYSIVQSPDQGFLLAGKSNSPAGGDKSGEKKGAEYDSWVVKISSNGSKQWDKTYGQIYNYHSSSVSVALTLDGGYILGGTSGSIPGADQTEDSRGSSDYWIVKLTSSGEKQWDRTFGGPSIDVLSSLITSSDGAYVLAGSSYSVEGSGIGYEKSEANKGYYDYWIVKTVPDPQTPSNCTATGSILREYWSNITGNYVTAIPLHTTPTSSSQVTSFQGPVNVAENYGARYRGYICAPATGSYTFYISGDDNSELYLSTDDNAANKRKIASVPGSTGVKVWNKYSTQKSATISLQAGKKYYIEALHKEGLGGDNLAVGWMLPNTSTIAVISGSYLSPFVPTTPTGCTASGSILREYWSNITGNYVTAIPVNSTPTSSSQVTSFQGPVNVAENYGARYRGYICAPATGSYTFYISGDDNSELYLSTDDQPATKTRIASVPGSTGVKVWNKYSTQKSAVISLQADKKYYVEVLHKEGLGSDNLAVGWTVPGSSSIVVIPGSVLSPFVPSANARLAGEQTAEAIHTMSAYPNPFADKLTIALAGVEGKLTITVVDVVGRQQLSTTKQVSREQQALELDFSSYQLKAGVYLLRLQAEDGKSKVIRIIKN